MKRLLSLILAAVLLLCAAGCAAAPAEPTEPAVLDLSGKYALDTVRNEAIIPAPGEITPVDSNAVVFYHIFVGSFSDSNGDGIGDLRGIINRMDYINDGDPNSGVSLGAEGIWLSPIFVSPSYHKYDVADYYQVDPKFGTNEDLEELINLCHERGVKIILDMVINHTSHQHPWFKAFCEAHKNGDTESEYYDLFTWTAETVPGKTWYSISGSDHKYEGNFSSHMPELNYDNPDAYQLMLDVCKYYLELGVDGFRFDAAKYVYYGDTTPNIDFWNRFMADLRSIKPDLYSVAEVWDSDGVTIPYFSSTNCFNFSMAQANGQIATAAKAGDVNALTAYMEHYIGLIKAENPDAFPVTFIANHDTDRAAGFLNVSSGQAFVGANLSILMPGSSFIYYGEEIGLKGSRGGANTDANRRLAMLWGDGDTVSDPEGADYASEQLNGTVVDQLPNGDSLFNHYKKLISIRKAFPEIANGTYTALKTDSNVGGFVSEYNGSKVAVIHNTTLEAVTIDLAQYGLDAMQIGAFAGLNDAALEGTMLTIGAQTSVVLK